MSNAPEIKHCPFCGYADVHIQIISDAMGKHAEASCQICGVTVGGVGVMVGHVDPDELTASAVHAWNTRTEPRT